MELLDLRPISTGAPDDEKPDPPARYDYEIARENYRDWHRKRGRVCRYAGCDTKLRYSRSGQYCSSHELTAEALGGSKPGPAPNPKLPGLRAAREAKGLSRPALGELIGRSKLWAREVERGQYGVSEEIRRHLSELLEVSEEDLLAGEFVKSKGGRPRRGTK